MRTDDLEVLSRAGGPQHRFRPRRDVRGNPVFFINQQRVEGLQPLGHLQALVEQELKAKQQP